MGGSAGVCQDPKCPPFPRVLRQWPAHSSPGPRHFPASVVRCMCFGGHSVLCALQTSRSPKIRWFAPAQRATDHFFYIYCNGIAHHTPNACGGGGLTARDKAWGAALWAACGVQDYRAGAVHSADCVMPCVGVMGRGRMPPEDGHNLKPVVALHCFLRAWERPRRVWVRRLHMQGPVACLYLRVPVWVSKSEPWNGKSRQFGTGQE